MSRPSEQGVSPLWDVGIYAALIAVILISLPKIIVCSALSQPYNDNQVRKSSTSSGLRSSIGRINILKNRSGLDIVVQLVVENTTKSRMYIFATGDSRSSLSDGNSLNLKEIIGISYCKLLYRQEEATKLCINNHGMDLNYYSYIDAGDKSDLSIKYNLERTFEGYNPSGSISFRLILVSRTARSVPGSLEALADPKNVTSPEIVILNFPLTPLNVMPN